MIKDFKNELSRRTGVPATLLTGETAEENIAQAKAMLAYKREYEQQRPKSTAEQFADWIGARLNEEGTKKDPAGEALADIEEAVRVESGGYPMLQDGGQVDTSTMPDPRPACEQFEDWLAQRTAFNPFTDTDGWTKVL